MTPKIVRLAILVSFLTGLIVSARPAAAAGSCAALSAQTPSSPECDAEIAAFPEPSVIQLAADSRALGRYTFMRLFHGEDGSQPVTLYDNAGGNPIRTVDPGFNFVTVTRQVGDWYEVNSGEWVRAADLRAQTASTFAGVAIVEQPQYPLAWIAINTYTAEYPGGEQIIDLARLHFRYDLVNVYATVEVDGHNWYLIAPGEWVYHTWVAMAKPVARPEGVSGRWVAVDLYEQTLVAYENDTMVFATLISSGLAGWDTNEGLFNIWARFESDHMSGSEGVSDFYSLENVPYTMYFDGEISLHGTYWHDGFGYRHSHGCVNLSVTDAHWLFNWTSPAESREAAVYVYSSGVYS